MSQATEPEIHLPFGKGVLADTNYYCKDCHCHDTHWVNQIAELCQMYCPRCNDYVEVLELIPVDWNQFKRAKR